MKKIKLILSACLLVLVFTSCDPEILEPPACEKNKTARVQFKNRSASNKTFTIVWDGSVIETLYPSQDSRIFTELAGRHKLVFKVSNTGAIGCNPSNPVLVACNDEVFTCTY
jgi:hypothetical protein